MKRYLVTIIYTDSLGRRIINERTFFFPDQMQRWINCYKHNYNNVVIRTYVCELFPYSFGVKDKVRVRF